MPVFKQKTDEELAAKEQQRAEKEEQKRSLAAQAERRIYLATPVGRAETAFERGDQVFQYDHDVVSQAAVIIKMVGSTTRKKTADPSELLNAVCQQGWELVNGSFVFITEGEQSRDKFLASGQNVAVKGRVVGYYLFKRCETNRVAATDLPAEPTATVAAGWYDDPSGATQNSQRYWDGTRWTEQTRGGDNSVPPPPPPPPALPA